MLISEKYIHKYRNGLSGFGLVEVIVALAIFFVIAITGVSTVVQSFSVNRLGEEETQATVIAQEGIEAVRSIKNRGVDNLILGTHGLENSGGFWQLSGSADTVGKFTREIDIEVARRNIAGDIVDSGGSIDCKTWKVTSTVSWDFTSGRNNEVKLTTYLTAFGKPIFPDTWGSASVVGSINFNGNQDGFKVDYTEGDYAYFVLRGGNPDYATIDITNPTSPTIASSRALVGNPRDIYVNGDYAYIVTTANNAEFVVLDISDPTSTPPYAAALDLPGSSNAFGVFASGNYAYVGQGADSGDEFFVIDISNISSPSIVGSTELTGNVNDIMVRGNYAYVANADNSQELQVVDISSPSSPSLVGIIDLDGGQNGLAVRGFGNCVIIGRSGNGRTHTVDVSDPTNPQEIDMYQIGDDVRDLDLSSSSDRVLLATDTDSGEFQMLSIEDLSNINPVESVNFSDDLNGVVYDDVNDRVYAATDSNSQEFIVISP